MQFGWIGGQIHGGAGIGQTQFIGGFCSVAELVIGITRVGFNSCVEHEHGCWHVQFGWVGGQIHGGAGIGQTQFNGGFCSVVELVIGITRVGFNSCVEHGHGCWHVQFGWIGGQIHGGAGIGQTQFNGGFCSVAELVIGITRVGFNSCVEHEHGCWHVQFGWVGGQVHGGAGIGQTQFIGCFCSDVLEPVIGIIRIGFNIWTEHEHGC